MILFLHTFDFFFYLFIRISFKEHSPRHQLFLTAFQSPVGSLVEFHGALLHLQIIFYSDGMSKFMVINLCLY